MIKRVLVALPVAAAVAVLAVPAAFADTTPVATIDITAQPGSYPVRTSGHWAEPQQEVLVSTPQNVLKAQTENGLGCYAEEGGFTVDRIETDPASGRLTAFDGSFDQRCPGSTGTAHGEIHFQR